MAGYPSESLAFYLRQTYYYRLLSAEEERVLCKQIHEYAKHIRKLDKIDMSDADEDWRMHHHNERIEMLEKLNSARNKMVTANLRLVISIARRYCNNDVALIDLIDEGNLGLIEAIERFDYRRGNRFSTYATWWVRQAISKTLAAQSSAFRIPVHLMHVMRKYKHIIKHLTQKLGRNPRIGELSSYLHMSEHRLQAVLRINQRASSLEEVIDEESRACLSEVISDRSFLTPVESFFQLERKEIIRSALEQLDDRERRIIEMRFGLNGSLPLTLDEIGRVLGLTRERVRQLQQKAIANLKKSSEIRDLWAS